MEAAGLGAIAPNRPPGCWRAIAMRSQRSSNASFPRRFFRLSWRTARRRSIGSVHAPPTMALPPNVSGRGAIPPAGISLHFWEPRVVSAPSAPSPLPLILCTFCALLTADCDEPSSRCWVALRKRQSSARLQPVQAIRSRAQARRSSSFTARKIGPCLWIRAIASPPPCASPKSKRTSEFFRTAAMVSGASRQMRSSKSFSIGTFNRLMAFPDLARSSGTIPTRRSSNRLNALPLIRLHPRPHCRAARARL